jgi:hypothetical protein
MRHRLVGSLALIAGLLLAAAPAVAHHSFAAEFDANKPANMTGVVTKVEWTNPHAWFYINVKDEATGKTTNWGFELGPPHLLQRSGWDKGKDTLQIGDLVTVTGTLAKNGSNRGNSRSITFAAGPNKGKRIGAASSQDTPQQQ